jgi:transposase
MRGALLNGLLPDEAVYFSDAVHPEYQSRPAHGWVRRGDRPAVRRGKGRERMNLMGALNLETFDLQLVETLKMSTQTTIDLLARLERHNPDKRLIHVVLDRAPVHRGGAVRDWLARPGRRIRLHFLPAYAPNLNAIERLWKVMHEHVTHNRYYDNFRTFAEAIMRFFKSTLPKNWKYIATPSTTTSTSFDPNSFGLSGRPGKTVPRAPPSAHSRCHFSIGFRVGRAVLAVRSRAACRASRCPASPCRFQSRRAVRPRPTIQSTPPALASALPRSAVPSTTCRDMPGASPAGGLPATPLRKAAISLISAADHIETGRCARAGHPAGGESPNTRSTRF